MGHNLTIGGIESCAVVLEPVGPVTRQDSMICPEIELLRNDVTQLRDAHTHMGFSGNHQ